MTPTDLKAARLALGLSQTALARRLDVTQSTIWRWEAGVVEPVHPTILRLALERLWLGPDDGGGEFEWPRAASNAGSDRAHASPASWSAR
jgi:transcriptional regulator with XRE-family HTH domain